MMTREMFLRPVPTPWADCAMPIGCNHSTSGALPGGKSARQSFPCRALQTHAFGLRGRGLFATPATELRQLAILSHLGDCELDCGYLTARLFILILNHRHH